MHIPYSKHIEKTCHGLNRGCPTVNTRSNPCQRDARETRRPHRARRPRCRARGPDGSARRGARRGPGELAPVGRRLRRPIARASGRSRLRSGDRGLDRAQSALHRMRSGQYGHRQARQREGADQKGIQASHDTVLRGPSGRPRRPVPRSDRRPARRNRPQGSISARKRFLEASGVVSDNGRSARRGVGCGHAPGAAGAAGLRPVAATIHAARHQAQPLPAG